MSFAFGFTEENFSDDELLENEFTGNSSSNNNQSSNDQNNINPLDLIDSVQDDDKRLPKHENFKDLVKSLKDVRITFETYQTPGGQIVYRRELFDVKHQLMNEDDNLDQNDNDEFSILIGDNSTDLKKNVYEGGLKSWECSIDTVDKLSALDDENLFKGDFLELGCGTALPSTYIFNRLLQNDKITEKTFVLSDYNSSVLRLVTIPNLITTWASNISRKQLRTLQLSDDPELPIVDGELQLTESLLNEFLESLESRQITVEVLSGAWGRQFVNLVNSFNKQFGFIITSETIYSPDTLPIIGEVLIELITNSNNGSTIGIVSAKDIYFGVGGSIVEFENYLSNRQSAGLKFSFKTEKIKAGLKRSIVFIE